MKIEKTQSNEVREIIFTTKANRRIDALKEFIKRVENANTLITSGDDDDTLENIIEGVNYLNTNTLNSNAITGSVVINIDTLQVEEIKPSNRYRINKLFMDLWENYFLTLNPLKYNRFKMVKMFFLRYASGEEKTVNHYEFFDEVVTKYYIMDLDKNGYEKKYVLGALVEYIKTKKQNLNEFTIIVNDLRFYNDTERFNIVTNSNFIERIVNARNKLYFDKAGTPDTYRLRFNDFFEYLELKHNNLHRKSKSICNTYCDLMQAVFLSLLERKKELTVNDDNFDDYISQFWRIGFNAYDSFYDFELRHSNKYKHQHFDEGNFLFTEIDEGDSLLKVDELISSDVLRALQDIVTICHLQGLQSQILKSILCTKGSDLRGFNKSLLTDLQVTEKTYYRSLERLRAKIKKYACNLPSTERYTQLIKEFLK